MIAVFASDVARVGTGTSRQTLLLGFRSAAGATAVAYAVNLAVLPFVLHRVGPHVYGAWATIASLLAIGGLADAGVRLEIVRRVAKARGAEDDDALVAAVHEGVTVLVLLASLVLVAGLTGAAFIRAFAFPDGVAGYTAPALDGLVRSVFALVAASLVLNGYFGVLRGVQRADVEATAQVVAVVVAAAVTVVGIARGFGLWALLAGSLAQLSVVSAWKWVGTRRLIPNLRPRLLTLGRVRVRSYLALSGLVLVAQVADVVDFQWDKLVLSHFVGSAVVASYHVGTGLVLQAKALAMLPMAPLVVAVAELSQRDAARLHALSAELVRAGMVLGSVVLGGLYAFAPAFFHLWLGPDVPRAGGVARLYVIAAAVYLLSTPLACRALGEGWYRLVAAGAVVNMAVNGALSLGLTVVVGLNGPLYGSIAGAVANAVVLHAAVRGRCGGGWNLPPLRAAGLAAAVTAVAVALGLDQARSWGTLGLAAASYAVVVGALCLAAEALHVTSLLSRRPESAVAGGQSEECL